MEEENHHISYLESAHSDDYVLQIDLESIHPLHIVKNYQTFKQEIVMSKLVILIKMNELCEDPVL